MTQRAAAMSPIANLYNTKAHYFLSGVTAYPFDSASNIWPYHTMVLHTRQQVLIALIVICFIFIIYWWYQSPYGPGGRYRYGLLQVSWTNGEAGTGKLVLALNRPPAANLCGGRISSFTPGLIVNGSNTLKPEDATLVETLLQTIVNVKVDAVDADAHSLTFFELTPPKGWPFAPTTTTTQTWVATTTLADKHTPSTYINVIPSELKCKSVTVKAMVNLAARQPVAKRLVRSPPDDHGGWGQSPSGSDFPTQRSTYIM